VLHVKLCIILIFSEFIGIISECIRSFYGMIVRVETELFATPICPPQLRNVKLGDGAVERQLSLRCIEIRGDDNSVARPTS